MVISLLVADLRRVSLLAHDGGCFFFVRFCQKKEDELVWYSSGVMKQFIAFSLRLDVHLRVLKCAPIILIREVFAYYALGQIVL